MGSNKGKSVALFCFGGWLAHGGFMAGVEGRNAFGRERRIVRGFLGGVVWIGESTVPIYNISV